MKKKPDYDYSDCYDRFLCKLICAGAYLCYRLLLFTLPNKPANHVSNLLNGKWDITHDVSLLWHEYDISVGFLVFLAWPVKSFVDLAFNQKFNQNVADASEYIL